VWRIWRVIRGGTSGAEKVYLLFLATGFFFLLWSAKSGKWWTFLSGVIFNAVDYVVELEPYMTEQLK
jgi:hypothetical protein